MPDTLENHKLTIYIYIGGRSIFKIRFSDDISSYIDLLTGYESELQALTYSFECCII